MVALTVIWIELRPVISERNYVLLLTELNPAVQSYLDEHLLRSFSQKTVNVKSVGLRPRHLRRRMSCKGAIKKTRSINVDCIYQKQFLFHPNPFEFPIVLSADTLGMEGHNINERRQSSAVPPPWLEAKQQPYTNVFVSSQDKSLVAETDEGMFNSSNFPLHDRHDRKCSFHWERHYKPVKFFVFLVPFWPKIQCQRFRFRRPADIDTTQILLTQTSRNWWQCYAKRRIWKNKATYCNI